FFQWWFTRRLLMQILRLNKTRERNHKIHGFWKRTGLTREFVNKYVPRRVVRRLSDVKTEAFDALIVGSDQIWRPRYYKEIEDSFLAFARDWKIKKIAYAPSFGVQHWEFSERQTMRCAELLKS